LKQPPLYAIKARLSTSLEALGADSNGVETDSRHKATRSSKEVARSRMTRMVIRAGVGQSASLPIDKSKTKLTSRKIYSNSVDR